MTKGNKLGSTNSYRRWLGHVMLAMCLSNSVAFACSPRVKGVDLQFPKNVHTLNASAALKLGTWLADLRIHYPNYDYFFIAAYLVGGDTGGRRLVSARAETVHHFLVSRGFNPARIHTSARATFLDDPAMGESGRAVGVDFLPACPHVCCDMPTHRVKFTGLPMPEDSGIAHQ